jgi:hypothetical protein
MTDGTKLMHFIQDLKSLAIEEQVYPQMSEYLGKRRARIETELRSLFVQPQPEKSLAKRNGVVVDFFLQNQEVTK